MYCPSCGAAVAQGISYCNLCGAKLGAARNVEASKPTELFSDSLIWASVTVFTVGLGVTIGLMAMMKELLNFSQGLIIAFALVSFLLTFVVEGVLIWLMLQRLREAKKANNSPRPDEQMTKGLNAVPQRSLPEPLPSVTEHTTRTLEPVYSERKSI